MSKEEMKNRKAEVFRKIIDTAWDIAIKDGLESLSIRKVASELDFAPNNLYNYFKNKDELLYLLKKDAYEWTLSIVSKDIPVCETVREQLEIITRRLMNIALEQPEKYIIMTSDLIMDSEEPLDWKINEIVAELISTGIDKGELRTTNPQMTATNIRITVIAFIRWISAQKNLTSQQAELYLVNLLGLIFDGVIA